MKQSTPNHNQGGPAYDASARGKLLGVGFDRGKFEREMPPRIKHKVEYPNG